VTGPLLTLPLLPVAVAVAVVAVLVLAAAVVVVVTAAEEVERVACGVREDDGSFPTVDD
jgi:hypothetical protein